MCGLLTFGTQRKRTTSARRIQNFPWAGGSAVSLATQRPIRLFQAPITAQFCQLEPPGPSGNNRFDFAALIRDRKSHRGIRRPPATRS